MAKKPFEIQSADLVIGGVNLQAGTTGVVIPGVTQAANYFVEEVDDVDGSNPATFGTDPEAVLLLDNAAYLFRSGTETPSGSYSEAGYSVQDLDDGEIEEIYVEVEGTFLSADKTFAEAGNMWASTVADAKTKPQFDTNDWTQIPFRPKMRAGEIQNVGGGGIGDIVVDVDEGNTSLTVANKDFNIVTTREGPETDADISLIAADDIWIEAGGDELHLSANNDVIIGTGFVDGDPAKEWTFDTSGHITFPDGSVQTTAYTGNSDTVWIQDFETTDGSPTDVPSVASSVEYLSNGDLIALFNHNTSASETYNSVARFDATGTMIWSMRFTGSTYTDGWGLAVDTANGFIYVSGERSGVTYTSGTLTKINQETGSVVWSKVYDVGYDNINTVVDVASDGNPVIVGYAHNGADDQVTVTKINASTGTISWARALNGQADEEAYGMAVGPDGEIVAVGWMDQLGLGSADAAATVVAVPSSNPNWTNQYYANSPGPVNIGGGVTVDLVITDGIPVITVLSDTTGGRTIGDTITTLSGEFLGGVTGVDDMVINVASVSTDPGSLDDHMLVVKYDSTGSIEWQKAVQVETGYNCSGADADIDSNGNIYVCGQFGYDNNGSTNNAMVIIKFDNLGVKQWTRKVVGDCDDWSTSIAVGPDDRLYLTGVTGNNSTSDFTMVVAKYTLDGLVEWQRLLDNTTTWTFAGAAWFGPGGQGSTIAVKSGYVAVVGGFADPGPTVPHAILAQFDTSGTTWAAGNYDFKAATFSGLLDSSASNITVGTASKTDFDFSSAFDTYDFNPDVDVSNFLVGTLYVQGDTSNTGDVTFTGVTIQGDGDEYGGGGLNLSPGPALTSNSQYFRIRGGDDPIHLHFDTSDNSTFDQYFGDDNKFLKLDHTGPISIGTNSNSWAFGTDGSTTFPTLTVPISDNATPSGTGQTLKFSDPAQQAIIYGPASTTDINNAERVIIQGAPGFTGTTGEGGDIYLWAGPGGDAGGDGGDIKIRAGRGQLTGGGGYLNFQAGQSNGTGNGGWIGIESGSSDTYGNGGYITIQARSGGTITLRTYNSDSNSKELVLNNDGNVTFPGALVESTVAKTGADINANDAVFVVTAVDGLGAVTEITVTNSPNPAWVTGTSGLALTDVDFTVSFDGSGNATVVVNSSGNGHSVSETFSLPATSVGATAPTPTALDLTKSIQKLADGVYSLADGVEGQVIHLVPSPSTTLVTNAVVVVAHARSDAGQFTNGSLYPFSYWVGTEQVFTSMCTLIFTDEHWQQTGGGWD